MAAIDLVKTAIEERHPATRAALARHGREAIARASSWAEEVDRQLHQWPAATPRGRELGAQTVADEVQLAFVALARVLADVDRIDRPQHQS